MTRADISSANADDLSLTENFNSRMKELSDKMKNTGKMNTEKDIYKKRKKYKEISDEYLIILDEIMNSAKNEKNPDQKTIYANQAFNALTEGEKALNEERITGNNVDMQGNHNCHSVTRSTDTKEDEFKKKREEIVSMLLDLSLKKGRGKLEKARNYLHPPVSKDNTPDETSCTNQDKDNLPNDDLDMEKAIHLCLDARNDFQEIIYKYGIIKGPEKISGKPVEKYRAVSGAEKIFEGAFEEYINATLLHSACLNGPLNVTVNHLRDNLSLYKRGLELPGLEENKKNNIITEMKTVLKILDNPDISITDDFMQRADLYMEIGNITLKYSKKTSDYAFSIARKIFLEHLETKNSGIPSPGSISANKQGSYPAGAPEKHIPVTVHDAKGSKIKGAKKKPEDPVESIPMSIHDVKINELENEEKQYNSKINETNITGIDEACIHLKMAIMYVTAKKYDDSKPCIERAFKWKGLEREDEARLRLKLAAVYTSYGYYKGAQEQIDAIKIEDLDTAKKAALLRETADLCSAGNRHDEAAWYLEQELGISKEKKEKEALLRLKLAAAYSSGGCYAESREQVEHVINIKGLDTAKKAALLMETADSFGKTGKYNEEAWFLEQALRISKKKGEKEALLRLKLAVAYRSGGRYAESDEQVKHVINIKGLDTAKKVFLLMETAKSCRKRGRYDHEVWYIRKALEVQKGTTRKKPGFLNKARNILNPANRQQQSA